MSGTVTIESTVDPFWIEFCMRDRDVFGTLCCGSWAFGIAYDDERGWLLFEHEEKCRISDVPNEERALAAWAAGEPLPAGYFALDLATTKKAWAEGVKWRGEQWFANGDAPAYGYAIQKALFGEERYT